LAALLAGFISAKVCNHFFIVGLTVGTVHVAAFAAFKFLFYATTA
jgi:hypothetical protein